MQNEAQNEVQNAGRRDPKRPQLDPRMRARGSSEAPVDRRSEGWQCLAESICEGAASEPHYSPLSSGHAKRVIKRQNAPKAPVLSP